MEEKNEKRTFFFFIFFIKRTSLVDPSSMRGKKHKISRFHSFTFLVCLVLFRVESEKKRKRERRRIKEEKEEEKRREGKRRRRKKKNSVCGQNFTLRSPLSRRKKKVFVFFVFFHFILSFPCVLSLSASVQTWRPSRSRGRARGALCWRRRAGALLRPLLLSRGGAR